MLTIGMIWTHNVENVDAAASVKNGNSVDNLDDVRGLANVDIVDNMHV